MIKLMSFFFLTPAASGQMTHVETYMAAPVMQFREENFGLSKLLIWAEQIEMSLGKLNFWVLV